MKTVLKDFTDRSELLALMWQMANQAVDTRVLVIESESGMGKTYLLREFKAECLDNDIGVVFLDFSERYPDPGYMFVIKNILSQLGLVGFELVVKTIQEVIYRSERSAALEVGDVQIRQENERASLSIGLKSDLVQTIQNQPLQLAASSGNEAVIQSGGVNISGGTNIVGEIVGRDLIRVQLIVQRDDPFVQLAAEASITNALQTCLMQLTSEQRVVFLIDNWQAADEVTRKWLANSLVKWSAGVALPKVMVAIAGEEGVELEPRKRIQWEPLSVLEENDVVTYWVEICGLPQEDIPGILRDSGGIPFLLKGISSQRLRKKPG